MNNKLLIGLKNTRLKTYTLIPDEKYRFVVDVSDDVNLEDKKLTSLEFCPQEVAGGFYCNNNPELKEIQEITDFKLIFLEYKKTLITKFSDNLENDLINKNKKVLE